MHPYRIPIWKTAPFCRLLLPLMIGIVLQWYVQFTFEYITICLVCFSLAFVLIHFLPVQIRYKIQAPQGIILHLILASFAMLITWQKDIRHQSNWYGNYYNDSCALIIRINEPMIEKEKSFKANGYVEAIVDHGRIVPVKGKILLYFSKDPNVFLLRYGDEVLVQKPLQAIRNSGNPGAFNYRQYAAFQQVFHNVYLKQNEWKLLPGNNLHAFNQFIFSARDHIINVLRAYMLNSKNELGIAEALLIGYKEDLDKDLVQAYSNAGVVHIIAISGLHLGLIYAMLDWILKRLPFIKRNKILKMMLLLGSLWLFSLLTGAAASVLRSAVMFTFIVIGKNFFKQSSIYNSLAVSAFVLLCYDPYFLWDVGFQLSYLALIGIVALQQPIYRCFYIKNKWITKLWNLMSVTLAAQIFTFPICIYYFHQFPNLFFITNLVAVPLSTVILFAEILLIAVSWLHTMAIYIGKCTSWLVWLMNMFITKINHLPFSLWDNLYASLYTTWILYFFIIGICGWLLYNNKKLFRFAMICLSGFAGLHLFEELRLKQQAKMIVYNVPKYRAIDFIYQDKYCFIGDSILLQDALLQNFHLKPARISLQLNDNVYFLNNLNQKNNYFQFFNKRIMLVDSSVSYELLVQKIPVDILILSKNSSTRIAGILNAIKPSMIVFDSSNSLWRIAKWKKECLALDLPCFSIPEQGAFVLNID